jgi:hypothetical protein
MSVHQATPPIKDRSALTFSYARAARLAARLAAIRAQIAAVQAAPYRYGRAGPHRQRRDEDILLSLAADAHARMIEARVGQ